MGGGQIAGSDTDVWGETAEWGDTDGGGREQSQDRVPCPDGRRRVGFPPLSELGSGFLVFIMLGLRVEGLGFRLGRRGLRMQDGRVQRVRYRMFRSRVESSRSRVQDPGLLKDAGYRGLALFSRCPPPMPSPQIYPHLHPSSSSSSSSFAPRTVSVAFDVHITRGLFLCFSTLHPPPTTLHSTR